MKIDDIKKYLNNVSTNRKGDHIISDCPFCGKDKHFYINIKKLFDKTAVGLYKNCFDCKKCGEVGDLVKLLKQLGQEELLIDGEIIDVNNKLNNKLIQITKEEEINIDCEIRKLPIGFKRIYKSDYLTSRGFEDNDFVRYPVGITRLVEKLRDYLIFPIYENFECKGYVARSLCSKDELKKINEQRTKNGKRKILRWLNDNIDTSKLVYGLDEVVFSTKTLIVVEGLFDKIAVDKTFSLQYNPYIKCCHTFGKSISRYQVLKMLKKGVENLIIVQDSDAVNNTKGFISYNLKYFNNIWVGYTGDKDLGDSNGFEIKNIFESLKNSTQFNIDIVLKKELL